MLTKTDELFTREKDARRNAMTDLAWLTSAWGDGSSGTSLLSTWRHDGVVRPWKRRLSDDERSVLLSELLLRHPELVAEAEQITATLRAMRPSGPVSVAGRRAPRVGVVRGKLNPVPRQNPAYGPDLLLSARPSCRSASSTLFTVRLFGWLGAASAE